MLDPHTREPVGSPKKSEPTTLFARLKCPNCGRDPAVVFPLIHRLDRLTEDAPLVCLECCAAARGRS